MSLTSNDTVTSVEEADPAGQLTFTGHRAAVARGHFIRVVNYHNTPSSRRDALREELSLYAQRFASLTLTDLDSFFATGEWPVDRPGFLPVFYEGYRNSAEVAASVCDELGLTGWFPVCTGFVDCPVEEQEAFAPAVERNSWLVMGDGLELGAKRLTSGVRPVPQHVCVEVPPGELATKSGCSRATVPV